MGDEDGDGALIAEVESVRRRLGEMIDRLDEHTRLLRVEIVRRQEERVGDERS